MILHDEVVEVIKNYIIQEQTMDKYIIVTTLCDKKEIANKIQETLFNNKEI